MEISSKEKQADAISAPQEILHAVLRALNNGNISDAIDRFGEHFIFNDQALGLEFTEKGRLAEFFQNSRDFFPDAALEIVSSFGCGDHVITEWKITATEAVHYGSQQFRSPISFLGVSVVRIESGRIIQWSDYYDQSQSRRFSLAARFTKWIEY